MKNAGRIKWKNFLLLAIAMIAGIAFIGHLAFNAIMAESFKLNPPTQAEIAEDPTLARYAR